MSEISYNLIIDSDAFEEMYKKLSQALAVATMVICNGDRDNFELQHELIVNAIDSVSDLIKDSRNILLMTKSI